MNDARIPPSGPEVVLVLNSGVSFVEFEVFRMAKEQRMLAKGIVERIGQKDSHLTYERYDGHEVKEKGPIQDIHEALQLVCERCADSHFGVLESAAQLDAIGHRVVHGGEKFHESTRITEAVKKSIADCASLAPLHNPANLQGIEACEKAFPGVPNVAVFDTAFHHSMPPSSYLYAIPYELYEKYGVRKYGFHGCSHQYVAEATASYFQKPLGDLKLITCHLGKGCSITAIDKGQVVDTSMGMTPLPGLVMGTRCGDIDPAVILYLANEGMNADEIDELLNKKSGLLGIAGLGSGDMRDVIDAANKSNEQAARALWTFVQRLVSYIGAYYTILEGADAVVFTGGIGENSPYVRSRVVGQLGVLGCHLDEARNYVVGRAALISDERSTLKALVMPTNEELMIARETVHVLAGAV
ncbi:MAG TPA: acetate kinase [Verrucomicrobia bacterium]|nr:MAG: acetate kinase [Lentisphaerae bacterium GWF2_57_35]HBA83870.1 acetate kinase [Verrucomicrobiota bacterium]